MKKHKKMWLLILLLIFIIILVVSYLVIKPKINKNDNNDSTLKDDGQDWSTEELEDIEDNYNKLVEVLSNYPDFENSKIKSEREGRTLILDDKYKIHIVPSSYYINIRYEEESNDYCKIIDAVEVGLGAKQGESMNSCVNALDGLVQNEYMTVNFMEEEKIVFVDANKIGNFNVDTKIFKQGEFINLGTRNFGVQIDDFNITNTSSGYNTYTSSTNVCFSMINVDKKEREFIIKYYNENKEVLKEHKYTYTGQTEGGVIEHTCVSWEGDDIVKYFSIG